MGRVVCILLLLCMGATPALAQDRPGLVARLIQDSLSGPGRVVQVEGFSGALSGAARIERMTFADADGVWLTLEDMRLDWNRAALLRGALSVQDLSAGQLTLTRRPVIPTSPLPEAPAAEASGFAIPELPVSIAIDRIAIERAALGAPVLGQAAELALAGAVRLDGDGLGLDLNLDRLDRATDRIRLRAIYDRALSTLDLDAQVAEASQGLIGTLLQIPGAPALDLTARGQGSLLAYATDIVLASDGQERLRGRITLSGDLGADTVFDARLAGDITPLLAEEARAFVGPDAALRLAGQTETDGTLRLDRLTLRTEQLTLRGQAEIAADGLPQSFDLEGAIADATGARVTLPGGAATLARANLSARFDAAQGDGWTLDLDLTEPVFGDLSATRIGLDGTGQIDRSARAVTANLAFDLLSLASPDPALAESLGARLGGTLALAWADGAPLRLDRFTVGGADYGLDGQGTVSFADRTVTVAGEARAFADALARFSPLAGRPLTGQIDTQIRGEGDVLGGSFDASLVLTGQGLSLGEDTADRLLAGPVRLDTALRRDTEGTYLDRFVLASTGIVAEGQGAVGPVGSDLALTASLTDVALVAPDYSGALTVTGRVAEPEADRIAVDLNLDGPYGLAGTVTGELGAAAAQALTLELGLPDLGAIVPAHPGAVRITGTATDRAGTGTGTGTGAEAGAGTWDVDLDIAAPYDAAVAVKGRLGGGAGDVTLDARLPDLAPLVPDLPGPIQITGRATEGAQWSVDLDVAAPADLSARVSGTVGGGTSALDFAARLPDMARLVPSVPGEVALDGTARERATGWRIDTRGRLPYRATTAISAVLGPETEAQIALNLPDLGLVAPGLRGPADITATAQRGTGPWTVSALLSAAAEAQARITAQIGDAITADLTLDAPRLAAIVPGLPGGATGTARATRGADGIWRAKADLAGPYRSSVAAQGSFAPDALATEAQLTASLPDIGALVPQFSGPLRLQAQARQANADAYDLTVEAQGPYGTTAQASGRYAPGASQAELSAAIPNIAPLAPGLSGALRLRGTAQQDTAGWALDLQSNGPGAATLRVTGTTTPDARRVALRANGTAPLALANQIIAPREALGILTFDLSMNGAPGLEGLTGTVATENARLALPTLSQTFSDIDATARLADGRVEIAAGASGGSGGRLTANGPIDLVNGLDARLEIGFDALVVEDPSLFSTRLGGGLRIVGPLARGADIGGTVRIGRTEIRVPSGGLGFGAAIPKMTHLNEPNSVFLTRQRARAVDTTGDDRATPQRSVVHSLNIEIDAPNQIFVRGRGLDMELGGALRVSGSTAQPIPVGGINVIRGTLSILGKRLILSNESTLTIAGDFTPALDVSAETDAGDLTVIIAVTGPVDDPVITFTSDPPLPEDEVLARLLFGRGIEDLSAFQAAQLAASIAELTGRSSGPGILGSVRAGLGLDDLDIRSTEDGSTEVTAGRYLSDNIYTEVTTDGAGQSTLQLNIDLTDTIRMTGKAKSDGETSLGIFFERDY